MNTMHLKYANYNTQEGVYRGKYTSIETCTEEIPAAKHTQRSDRTHLALRKTQIPPRRKHPPHG